MPRDARFSVALHVLAHLAAAREPQTSGQLAACVGTNAVVVRRTLAGLREARLVASARGTGGGWTLARDPAELSLRDVHAALGGRLLTGIDVSGPRGRARCRIHHAVSGMLDEFVEEAEALLATRLDRITLALLAERVRDAAPRHERP